MAKTEVTQWDTTAANNLDINDTPLAENTMRPPHVNNAFREMMAQIRRMLNSTVFRLFDTTDPTKKLAFDLSGLTTATTRTYKTANYDGALGVQAKGANIASATTTDIAAASGDFADITGTTTIAGLGTADAGVEKTVRFTGILTLTHNATSLILYSGTNITTYNGLVMRFRSIGSGSWVEVSQTPAFGTYAPVLAFNSASVGITYTTQTGRWVRNGKTVTVEIYLVLSSKGSSGGGAAISIPFTKETGQVGTASAGLLANFSGLTAGLAGYINSGGTAILLRAPTATGSALVTDTNFSSTSEISLFTTYNVA